jgi:uncharacterized protein
MDKAYNNLLVELGKLGPMAVAFSGGVDSTLLLKAAHDAIGSKLLAITVVAPMHHSSELDDAVRIAKQIGVRHILHPVQWNELAELADNPRDRCYLCKKLIFSQCLNMAEKKEIRLLADGSTADDLLDHRPGAKALKELGVVSPLQQTGWTKQMIRAASRMLELPTADKPAQSCLLTRFPHNSLVTEDRLRRVELCEEGLMKLGFRQIRVRSIGNLARLEFVPEQLPEAYRLQQKITLLCTDSGFASAEIDPQGYRSGSMN